MLKDVILNHLKNGIDFGFDTDTPPKIGEYVKVIIDGEPVLFFVASFEIRKNLIKMNPLETIVTYHVRVKSEQDNNLTVAID